MMGRGTIIIWHVKTGLRRMRNAGHLGRHDYDQVDR